MKRYVDGFILPIPKNRLADYQKMAEATSRIWKEHGAIEYWECVGDDLNTEGIRSFGELTNTSNGETVIFSWGIQKDRSCLKMIFPAEPTLFISGGFGSWCISLSTAGWVLKTSGAANR